ncbi:hypothetical protein OGAPHI_006817 [Ogataea philodendri]|uniref:AAA+ ATPase domain-containing protein n=1 Tax=Ogataea philodendri TaxID=1378263 RepID=A0A9P8NX64_9ASCO|nr:uncharacterized protein OGAPHI_006817 [Ogataea philodendri]KAH3661410.1 hypothetical protein OGAPHI_006817 [Ogataea philodendri]
MMNVSQLVVQQFGGNRLDLVCRKCAESVKSMRQYDPATTEDFLKVVADFHAYKAAGPGETDNYLATVTKDDKYLLREKKGKGRGKPRERTPKVARDPKKKQEHKTPTKRAEKDLGAVEPGVASEQAPSRKPVKKQTPKGPSASKSGKPNKGAPAGKAKSQSKSKPEPKGKSQQKTKSEPENAPANEDQQKKRSQRIGELVSTTASEIPLKFESLDEYFHHFCYALLLEELHETEYLTKISVEWSREDPYGEFTVKVDQKEADKYSKNDPLSHLKSGPFSVNQGFFLVPKSATALSEETTFWCCSADFSKQLKRPDRVQIQMKAYPWNVDPIPAGSRPNGYALLPCGAVVSRIMQAISRLENPRIRDMLLGQKPIKQVFFKNRISQLTNTLNESQTVALQFALNNAITVLKGPPGSGKTSTIYEIVLQLMSVLHYHPILVVAASNIAVDNIAEKMMKNHKDDIIRVLSFAKESEYKRDHPLGSICLHHKIADRLSASAKDTVQLLRSGKAHKVSKNQFRKYLQESKELSQLLIGQAKVIFSTTVAIGGPYLKDLAQLPVVIVDEATQSSEPSSLIPLAAPNIQKVIFVGDEAQLSAFTRVKSLEVSLFERVLRNGTFEKPLMFDTQYRMHPEISEFPRKEFYDDKLQDGITAESRAVAGIQYPVYFWDHQGQARESRVFARHGDEGGYTFVNRGEVDLVSRVVEKLIVDKQVDPSRIGVITPYAGQRDLLSKSFEENLVINPKHEAVEVQVDKEDVETDSKAVTVHQINGILVASIDAFQGRETDFVVMSCVRSNEDKGIGFLRDRRRLNVALTRARCSLLLVGDVKCLKTDDLWKRYIETLEKKDYVHTELVY